MLRKIVNIDSEKCTGCGECAKACHEGAIAMVDGKAKLMREDYCDGLGDCLPVCPAGAISFVMREAPAYDEAVVKASKKPPLFSVSPAAAEGSLSNWPVQLKLAPLNAPCYEGCHLLVAADCTAYAYGSFHNDYIKGRTVIIGCPKLDGTDYTEKLAHIVRSNSILDITLVRMEVPCCGGMQYFLKNAIEQSGKDTPLRVDVISADGRLLQRK